MQVSPLLTFAFVKTCLKKHAIKNDAIDKEFAKRLYGKLCLFLSFFTWVGICIWMMANRFKNVLGTKFRFGDILLGVSLPFDVPSLQLPTAIFSFTFGLTKLLTLFGKAIKMGVEKFNETKDMGVEKIDEIKDSITDVVPGGTVEAQNDDNVAMMGAGEVTIEGNAAEMAKEMAQEKIQEQIQEKIHEKLEEKIENQIKEIENKIKEKLGDKSKKVTKEIKIICKELLNENKTMKNQSNKQQKQINKQQDEINRLMKIVRRGGSKQNGGVLVHPQQSKNNWSSITSKSIGRLVTAKKVNEVEKLAQITTLAHNKKMEERHSVASKRLEKRLSKRSIDVNTGHGNRSGDV